MMKLPKNVKLGILGIVLFVVGLWGGSFLMSVVSDSYRFATAVTGTYMALFGGFLFFASFVEKE